MPTNNNLDNLDQILTNGKPKSRAKAAANRSTANAEQAQATIQGKVAKARRSVADATKAQIIGGGIADALAEIARGDFGEIGAEIFEAFDLFTEGVEAGITALEAAEADPKYLLPPSPIPFPGSEEAIS